MPVSDVSVYLSSQEECPSEHNYTLKKDNPKSLSFFTKKPYANKVLPEYEKVGTKMVKLSQELYMTMHSYNGCMATVTIQFPVEKEKELEKRMFDALSLGNKEQRNLDGDTYDLAADSKKMI